MCWIVLQFQDVAVRILQIFFLIVTCRRSENARQYCKMLWCDLWCTWLSRMFTRDSDEALLDDQSNLYNGKQCTERGSAQQYMQGWLDPFVEVIGCLTIHEEARAL